MRTSHKIEIFTGIATPIAAFMYFYFGVIRLLLDTASYKRARFTEGLSGSDIAVITLFAIVWLFSLLVGYGAYHHVKGSDMAVEAIYLGGGVIIVFLGLWGLLVLVFGGILYGALAYLPVILSFITIVMAAYSRERNITPGLNLEN